jgi:hypothetical protein
MRVRPGYDSCETQGNPPVRLLACHYIDFLGFVLNQETPRKLGQTRISRKHNN